jgi:hypothetical protein
VRAGSRGPPERADGLPGRARREVCAPRSADDPAGRPRPNPPGTSEVYGRYTRSPAAQCLYGAFVLTESRHRPSGDYGLCPSLKRGRHRDSGPPGTPLLAMMMIFAYWSRPFGLAVRSMFARTSRYSPAACGIGRLVVDISDRTGWQVMADSGTSRYQLRVKNRPEQRTLNPRVRGSSPWRRT